MAKIEVTIDINSTIDNVWSIISDVDNEPKFWKGTKEVHNISKDGNIVNREITIAFKDKKCMQIVTLSPKEKVHADFTKGIIKGTKTVTIQEKDNLIELRAVWDISLSGMMGMFTGMITKHIKSGTEQALQSIKKEVEN